MGEALTARVLRLARLALRLVRGADGPTATTVGAALALAALAALAASRWSTALLPAPAPLAALAALLLVFALRRPGAPAPKRDLPVAAALGLLAGAAHLAPGMLLGHDTLHHIWGAAAYQNAWRAGDLLPIWLHQLGIGMPMPMFYGLLPYWAMAPFAIAGGGPAHLLAGSFVLASALAAVAAWTAVASWTNDRRAALVAATAWAFAPFRLLDANYRGALAESWALALLPFVLLAFDRLLLSPSRRRLALAAVSVTAITIAHPLSLAELVVLLPALGAARLPALLRAGGARAAARATGRAAVAAIAGISLAGFLAVPLLVESRYLRLDRGEARQSFATQGVAARQIVERRAWDELRWSRATNSAAARRSEMPFYAGWIVLAGLAGATFGALRGKRRDSSPLAALAAVGLVALACALRASAPLLLHLPGLSILQFPWRFLGPASAAGALALGCLSARLMHRLRGGRAYLAGLILALAALTDGFAFSGGVERVERWRGLVALDPPSAQTGLAAVREVPEPWPARVFGVFLPPWSCCADVSEIFSPHPNYYTAVARRTAAGRVRASVGLVSYVSGELRRIDSLPYARLLRGGEAAPEALEFTRASGTITVALPPDARGRIEVAEQYFPGWQVRAGERWSEVVATPDGLLAAEAEPGARALRFRFDRWRWDRSLGWLLSFATLLGLFACVRGSRPALSRAASA